MGYQQPLPFPVVSHLSRLEAGLDTVASPSEAWLMMAERWELLHDLLGGTLRMREVGEKWLPKEPREEHDKYLLRLNRAVLYEGLRDTMLRIVSKPFSREVVVNGELAEPLQRLVTDADRMGTTLTAFGRNLFWDALLHGKTHFLVDFPMTNGTQTRRDERRGLVGPYFKQVSAPDLIGWRDHHDRESGTAQLDQVRIREMGYEDLGDYASERVHRVRVLRPDGFELWKRTAKDKEYFLDAEGAMVMQGRTPRRIPIVTIYFNREAFFTANPPLEGLAWLNLAHWQSSSDYRNYLRFARIGILMAKGFQPEEIEKGIKISPNSLTSSVNPEASLTYVEHTGKAFEAGVQDLQMLEERMETLGLQPLIEGTASSTATGKVIDEGKQDSQVQAWVRAVEQGLHEGFQLAYDWIGQEMPEDVSFNIFNEFKLSVTASDDIDKLIRMREPGAEQIDHETFINEVRRRGLLADDTNHETIAERLAEERLRNLPDVEDDESEIAGPSN